MTGSHSPGDVLHPSTSQLPRQKALCSCPKLPAKRSEAGLLPCGGCPLAGGLCHHPVLSSSRAAGVLGGCQPDTTAGVVSVGLCQLWGSGNLPGSSPGSNHNRRGGRERCWLSEHLNGVSNREPEQLFGVVPGR